MEGKFTNQWKTPPPVQNFDHLPEGWLTPIKEILIRRGILDKETHIASYEISSLPKAEDHFKELSKASSRIIKALNENKKIAICGDYDADGMTSTALLCDYLSKINAKPVPFIPSREDDGYGLNSSIVQKIHDEGIQLIITVDNGVSAIEALNKANSLGIDVILTDHHQIKTKLPTIYALLHPIFTPKDSPYKYLAGVGVAYLLAESVARMTSSQKHLNLSRDLFCIGTVADMALLKGANRFWIRQWIKKLSDTESPGLKGLLTKSKLNNKIINTEDISFKIAPRINSVGRIGDPKLILNLLLESDPKKATKLVNKCEKINVERKTICKQVTEEAFQILQKDSCNIPPFIFLAQPHWPAGVIGIIASRVMEKYNRPTAVLCSDNDGLLRASIRAPSTFNVFKALEKCECLLEKYGGHAAAGGFTIKANKVSDLHNRLNELCITENHNMNVRKILPEAYIELINIDQCLCNNLEHLEPFGQGNKRPLFWTRGCEVIKKETFFNGLNKITLKQGNTLAEATTWDREIAQINSKKVDVAFYIEHEDFCETEILQIRLHSLKEFKRRESFLFNKRIYSCYIDGDGEVVIENSKGKSLIKSQVYDDINCDYISKLFYTSSSILGVNI